MSEELYCSIHGPFPAQHKVCPYCASNRREDPRKQAPDDDPTDLSIFRRSKEEDPSSNPDYRGGRGIPQQPPSWDNDTTEISIHRRGRIDQPDGDKTQFARVHQEDITEVDVPSRGVLGLLWVKNGLRRGRVYIIRDGTTVGRGDVNLILDDLKVSNQHARFVIDNGQFLILDLESRNGTFVNHERIYSAVRLKENDEIRMGDASFLFKILPPAE